MLQSKSCGPYKSRVIAEKSANMRANKVQYQFVTKNQYFNHPALDIRLPQNAKVNKIRPHRVCETSFPDLG